MLESMIVTFREGMEAFLIVAICIAYLKRTNKETLLPPVYAGIAVAVIASGILGVWLQSVAGDPAVEGGMAMVAGVLVATLTVHMIKASKTLSKAITKTLERNANKTGIWAGLGIFTFVTLMITREGMETALLMNAIMTEESFATMMSGAVIGVLLAIGAGILWIKKSHLIHLGRFLKVTSIFLLLFAIHLFVYGFHELTEVQALPFIDNYYWHDLSEVLEGNEIGGQIIGVSLIAVPMAWLGFVTLRDYMSSKSKLGAAAE